MAIIRFDPLSDIAQLLEINGKHHGKSATDIYEKDNTLFVKVEVPGINPEHIKIDLENDNLRITGHEEKTEEVKKRNYYLKEIRTGNFERLIHLPIEVDADNVAAQVQDGVLTISLPKKTKTEEKRKITVKKAHA